MILLGPPHVLGAHMGHTRGEPNETELPATHVFFPRCCAGTYVSTDRRSCPRMKLAGKALCQLHQCTAPGCTTPKSSKDRTCPASQTNSTIFFIASHGKYCKKRRCVGYFLGFINPSTVTDASNLYFRGSKLLPRGVLHVMKRQCVSYYSWVRHPIYRYWGRSWA